jgi:hypothetical protein
MFLDPPPAATPDRVIWPRWVSWVATDGLRRSPAGSRPGPLSAGFVVFDVSTIMSVVWSLASGLTLWSETEWRVFSLKAALSMVAAGAVLSHEAGRGRRVGMVGREVRG